MCPSCSDGLLGASRRVAFLFAAALVILVPAASAQSVVLSVTAPLDAAATSSLRGDDGRSAVLAAHVTRLDAAALGAAVDAVARGASPEIALEVAPGDALGYVLLTAEPVGGGGYAVAGEVAAGGRRYAVRYGGNGRQAVYEVAPDAGASCGTDDVASAETRVGESPGDGIIPPRPDLPAVSRSGATQSDTVRVLLLYTDAAVAGSGPSSRACSRGSISTA